MIIAVEPQQIGTAGRWGKPLAHIAYRVGEGPIRRWPPGRD